MGISTDELYKEFALSNKSIFAASKQGLATIAVIVNYLPVKRFIRDWEEVDEDKNIDYKEVDKPPLLQSKKIGNAFIVMPEKDSGKEAEVVFKMTKTTPNRYKDIKIKRMVGGVPVYRYFHNPNYTSLKDALESGARQGFISVGDNDTVEWLDYKETTSKVNAFVKCYEFITSKFDAIERSFDFSTGTNVSKSDLKMYNNHMLYANIQLGMMFSFGTNYSNTCYTWKLSTTGDFTPVMYVINGVYNPLVPYDKFECDDWQKVYLALAYRTLTVLGAVDVKQGEVTNDLYKADIDLDGSTYRGNDFFLTGNNPLLRVGLSRNNPEAEIGWLNDKDATDVYGLTPIVWESIYSDSKESNEKNSTVCGYLSKKDLKILTGYPKEEPVGSKYRYDLITYSLYNYLINRMKAYNDPLASAYELVDAPDTWKLVGRQISVKDKNNNTRVYNKDFRLFCEDSSISSEDSITYGQFLSVSELIDDIRSDSIPAFSVYFRKYMMDFC